MQENYEIPSMTPQDIKDTVYTIVFGPLALMIFIISICLENRNVFARFDEIP